jgi:hypothetical protein
MEVPANKKPIMWREPPRMEARNPPDLSDWLPLKIGAKLAASVSPD